MSHNPAQSHHSPRRRRSSGIFSNSVLAIILIVGCVYAIWGVRPLRNVWMAMGFGRKSKVGVTVQVPPAGSPQSESENWIGPNSKSDVPPPPLPLAELTRSHIEDETEPNPFLPNKRLRSNTAIRRPTNSDVNGTEAELDRRFELETPHGIGTNSNSVRTAEFEEPADSVTPRHQRQPLKKLQFEVEGDTVESEQPDESAIRPIGDGEKNKGTEQQEIIPIRGGVKTKPASTVPGKSGSLNLQEVQQLIDAGRDAEAYQFLATAYTQNASDRPRFQELLDQVAHRIYFTPQPQIIPPYEIQPGDQLRKIAAKYHLSWQYLSKLNQVDARKIRPGKKLKVFQGPFNASVNLTRFELVVTLNGNYVKRFSVGVGKDNSSPQGEFAVKEKLENPTYYGPEGNVLAADDPKNPLGERWIDIGNSFGIHGTIDPESIGKSDSAGCIRMRNEDVAEVYDLLTVGSTVTIHR